MSTIQPSVTTIHMARVIGKDLVWMLRRLEMFERHPNVSHDAQEAMRSAIEHIEEAIVQVGKPFL